MRQPPTRTLLVFDSLLAQQTHESVNPHPVSSSDVQSPSVGGMTFGKPRPLTISEVEDVVNRFAYAAKVLYDVSIT